MNDDLKMDKSFVEKVAKNIKKYREQKKLTQMELAVDARISPSTVAMFETVRNDITLSKINYIAKALGVEPYELLMFDD